MEKATLLSEEKIISRIYVVKGKKVMLDRDLAEMYGVLTGNLNKAVKRNLRRFPDDFMFQLDAVDLENLKSQFVTSNSNQRKSNLIFQIGTSSSDSKSAWGGVRKLPFFYRTRRGDAFKCSQ